MARPPKVTDEEILTVACRCFLDGGPSVPTSAIASELGVSEAALFKRFGTKRELMIQACSPPVKPEFMARLMTGPSVDRPIDAQIEELALVMVSFFRELMPRMAVFKAAGISPLDVLDRMDVPPPVMAHAALTAWFDRAQELGLVKVEDTSDLAFTFLGSLHGRTMLTAIAGKHLPPFDVDAYVQHVVSLLLNGIRAGEAA